MEKTPQQVAATDRLRKWALEPTGGGRVFAWNTPGDMTRCMAFYRDKMPGRMIPGWCARLHHMATGRWPGSDTSVEDRVKGVVSKAKG